MSGRPGAETTKKEWRRWLRDQLPSAPAPGTKSVVAQLVEFVSEFGRVPDPKVSARRPHDSQPAHNQPSTHRTGGDGRLILFYRAMPHELSLDGLADVIGWQRFAVTRTPPAGPLTLHPAIGAMEQHRYGFPQPTAEAFELQPRHVSLALVPGVAFDRHGTRLGHGVGYYDELLARLPDDCPRVGVTRREMIFDRLPAEAHDVPMTHLATEDGVIEVGEVRDLSAAAFALPGPFGDVVPAARLAHHTADRCFDPRRGAR